MAGNVDWFGATYGDGTLGGNTGGGGNVDLTPYAKKEDVKGLDEVELKSSDTKKEGVVYIDTDGTLWTYHGTKYIKSKGIDAFMIPISRGNAIENVAPDVVDAPPALLVLNSYAVVYLTSGHVEYWRYNGTAWNRRFIIKRQARTFQIRRANKTEDIAPTSSEAVAISVDGDTAFIVLSENDIIFAIEKWKYTTSWAKDSVTYSDIPKSKTINNANFTIPKTSKFTHFLLNSVTDNVTITLPKNSDVKNKIYTFKADYKDIARTITIKPFAGDIIQGNTTGYTINHEDSISLISDGTTHWHIVAEVINKKTFSSLLDDDNDTLIELERTADVDRINFKTAGADRAVLDANGFGIGSMAEANANLHIQVDGTSRVGTIARGRGILLSGTGGKSRFYHEQTNGTSGKRLFMSEANSGHLAWHSMNDAGTAFTKNNILTINHDGGIHVSGTGGDSSFNVSSGSNLHCATFRGGNGAGATARTQIGFGWQETDDYQHRIVTDHDGGNKSGNKIKFKLWNRGVDTASTLGSLDVMTLTGEGRIGIGTISPTTNLHVVGGARITEKLFDGSNSSGSDGQVLTSKANKTKWTTPSYTQIQDADGDTGIKCEKIADIDNINFRTNGTERMVIKHNGNTVIGGNNPKAVLQVGNGVGTGNPDVNSFFVTYPALTSHANINQKKTLIDMRIGGTGGQTYDISAKWKMCRYEDVSTHSRTQLSLGLTHDQGTELTNDVITFKSSGDVVVPYSLILPNGKGNGKVLTSDANGKASWKTAGGGYTSVDNRVPKANGVTGALQNSWMELDDNGNIFMKQTGSSGNVMQFQNSGWFVFQRHASNKGQGIFFGEDADTGDYYLRGTGKLLAQSLKETRFAGVRFQKWSYVGSTTVIDYVPLDSAGGMFKITICSWRGNYSTYNINYWNGGGSRGPITRLQQQAISWKGNITVSASVRANNVIRLKITRLHSNAHGWKCTTEEMIN